MHPSFGCTVLSHSIVVIAAPNIPTINTAARLSGANGTISWDPITPENARGFLTSIQLAYEASERTGMDECPSLDVSKHVVTFTDNLYQISTYSIPDLTPDEEYCVAIRASTSVGPSDYSQPIRMSCELPSTQKNSHSHILCFLSFFAVAMSTRFQVRFTLPEEAECKDFIVSSCVCLF